MAVETWEDGEPIPDGYAYLTLREPLWEVDKNQRGPYEHKLEFKYYRSFRHDALYLVAKHREGHTEYYVWNNILYVEWHMNSPEVQQALKDWQVQKSKMRSGGGHSGSTDFIIS
jgi:hypothetical protein